MNRFSSRLGRLDQHFLASRLRGAKRYDRIAGYFNSSLLELVGESLESMSGKVRVICNSDLDPLDVKTAKAAKDALWRSWCASEPEERLTEAPAQARLRRLYEFLRSGKLEVRVLPDTVFGLVHGKAGVIELENGTCTAFMGSANESRRAWVMNYELVWEDPSDEAVRWVQTEFDALWNAPQAVPLCDAVIQDFERLSKRTVIHTIDDWTVNPDPGAAIIETPVYRRETGLWAHQKYFVKTVMDAHLGVTKKARFILADQVGLGKTIQLGMSAELIALHGDQPILVICPKTVMSQWQAELNDLLNVPTAIWTGLCWQDENGIEYPKGNLRNCPRRIGIISSGLVTRGAETTTELLKLKYDLVILDEAHRARRGNLGIGRDAEQADANNLLKFMYQIAEQSRSVLLATATPVQMRPIEAWDLLDVLSRGDESVLGNYFSPWRKSEKALDVIMTQSVKTPDDDELWAWTSNPLPPSTEARDFSVLRQRLGIDDSTVVASGGLFGNLRQPDIDRLRRLWSALIKEHNPFIRRIVRRTRKQLEAQIDPETHEPLLQPIRVKLHGEEDPIILPHYLKNAYELAEEFSRTLAQRMRSAGFLKTLLLRRVGSSMHAGLLTAEKILATWTDMPQQVEAEQPEAFEDTEDDDDNDVIPTSKTLTLEERVLLEQFREELAQFEHLDPKPQIVLNYLQVKGWLEYGCMIFSQYRDSIEWLRDFLTKQLPEETIGLYSGPQSSGIMKNEIWTPCTREDLKQKVRTGELRLLLGTDAASEGLNLQRLARLINLDLPWNPTRLEQRKGRIQRIGQIHDTIEILNLRYKDSVEDRVHQLLSSRFADIHNLFGQLPDVLESAWIDVAIGEIEEAKRIIDAPLPHHPFLERYSSVESVDWESTSTVLSDTVKRKKLQNGW